MKKIGFLLLFGLCPVFAIGCSAPTTQQNNETNAHFSNEPYYLTVCEYTNETTVDIKGYTLYKLNLNSTKSFTKEDIKNLVDRLSSEHDGYTFTLAAEYDGKVMTEYYVDFLSGDSSQIKIYQYNPLVVGDEAVPPIGISAYHGDDYWDNMRLKSDFLIDENLIYPRGGVPNGVFFATEAYAKSNNYKIQNIG